MYIAEPLAGDRLSLQRDSSSQDSSLQGKSKYKGQWKQDGARARKIMFTYVSFSSFCVLNAVQVFAVLLFFLKMNLFYSK